MEFPALFPALCDFVITRMISDLIALQFNYLYLISFTKFH